MAERQPGPGPVTRPSATRGGGDGGGGSPTGATFLRRFHGHAPNSAQLVGFITLVISGGILLILTGLTLTATVLALIFFTPLVLLSSPIWVPAGTVIFIAIAGFLSMCALGVASLAGLSWVYKYMRGWHPPGSDRVDYARSRIADTASHVKDYAREYGFLGHGLPWKSPRVRDQSQISQGSSYLTLPVCCNCWSQVWMKEFVVIGGVMPRQRRRIVLSRLTTKVKLLSVMVFGICYKDGLEWPNRIQVADPT